MEQEHNMKCVHCGKDIHGGYFSSWANGFRFNVHLNCKEHTMTQCGCKGRSCNGIIQKSDPRKVINGVVYSLVCGWKKEKENGQSPQRPTPSSR
jgi:hypothetical protein